MSPRGWWILVVVAAICAGLFVPLIDYAASKKVRVGDGMVLQKSYTAAASGTGVGLVPAGKAGASPIIIVQSRPEEWLAIVECDGKTFSVRMSADLWSDIEVGSRVDVFEYQGRLMTFRRVIEIPPRTEAAEA